jgi:hypothetical protein
METQIKNACDRETSFKKNAILGCATIAVTAGLICVAYFNFNRSSEKMSEPSAAPLDTASFVLPDELQPFLIAVWQDAYPEEVERIQKRLQAVAFRPRDGSQVEKDEINPSLVGLHGWERTAIKGWFCQFDAGSVPRSECRVELLPSENRLTVYQDREAIREFEIRFGRFLRRLE